MTRDPPAAGRYWKTPRPGDSGLAYNRAVIAIGPLGNVGRTSAGRKSARRASLRSRGAIALATFIAVVVVTLVAPFVGHAYDDVVCSAHGVKVVEQGGAPASQDHGAHCPLCMPAGAPPPTAFAADVPSLPAPSFVATALPTERRAGPVGAALPPRGPPVVS